MNIERYERAIKAALAVQQKRLEIEDELQIIADNLTAYEAVHRVFDNESAEKAIKILEPILGVEEKQHVMATINYQDVEIYLHTLKPHKFMKPIFQDICVKDIMG